MDPILEGLVTTLALDGGIHLAPMGPRIDATGKRLLLRPFPSSQTFKNLKAHGEGVFHITDDVLLLAQSALGSASIPPHRPAEHIKGYVLTDACRYLEFKVRTMDESQERVCIMADVVHAVTLRDFFGFNRAKHAVLEAAILATRLHLLPLEEIVVEYRKFAIIIDKTGGPAEHEAFTFLQAHLEKMRVERREP